MLRNLIVMAVLLGAVPAAHAQVEVGVSVSFDTFHHPLAAHGEWVVVGDYGRVWRPYRVVSDWRPYLDGHWVWTDEGWLWVSDEPWAWATYHYGRWSWEPGWGWIWVPGYEWAPAWVEWRYSEGCVGWAPLFPLGITIVHRPVYYDHWTFVPSHSFVGVHARHVAWTHERVREHWHRTVVAPSWHDRGHRGRDRNHGQPNYGTPNGGSPVHQAEPAFGPPRSFVERQVGRPIQPVRPVAVSSPSEVGRHAGAPVVFRPNRPERPASSAPATIGQPDRRASYPTPPDRRDVRPGGQPQPAPVVSRPSPVRPEPRPMVTRPEPARPDPRASMRRPEPMRPVYNRPEAVRPMPQQRPPEMTRPMPQRASPPPQMARPQVRPQPQPQVRPQAQPQPAVRPQAQAPQRHAVPQAQPNRPAGNDRRRR